ncbi:Histone-lysine N-methyltransferase SETMAR [Ooceraea biroi]|uniref:Histone-lysine N-methyltransferase SETMAR n=1 Tax=Ooceraea biroi TaxID=2015173 RepID=A0A026WDN7_OOCBI|nr:Histone-lysine N-methyltransferase SETMAR [Ooceraea biroi]
MEKKQLRAIFLYEFKLGHKAAEATRNINSAFGQGTANERTMQRWFQKFQNGDESLEDEEGRGRPSIVDNDELKVREPTALERSVRSFLSLDTVSSRLVVRSSHDRTVLATLSNRFVLNLASVHAFARLAKRLARGDRGINPLDAACREHDIAYSRSRQLSDRHAADLVLADRTRERISARNSSLGERAAAVAVWAAMKAKTKLGMGAKKKRPAGKARRKRGTTTTKRSARTLPIVQRGGLLPLLPVLGAKAKRRQLEELQRHNRAMEGRGLYLALHARGSGMSCSCGGHISKKYVPAGARTATRCYDGRTARGGGRASSRAVLQSGVHARRVTRACASQ